MEYIGWETKSFFTQLIHNHIENLPIKEYNFHYNIDVIILFLTYFPANILIRSTTSEFLRRYE